MDETLKSAVYFFQYLPPWRIDVFNGMAKQYDLTIVFFNSELEGFTYDRNDLLSRLDGVKVRFLQTGFNVGNRPFRTGIAKLLRQIHPDVVFVHEYSPVSIVISLLKRRFKYRLYVTTSDNLSMAEASSGLKAWARHFVLSRSEGAILYSREVAAFYQRRFPWLRTGICPNIQDPARLFAYRKEFVDPLPEGGRVILYIGRLVYVKGLDLLLEAYAHTSHSGRTLVLLGEGAERDALQGQAERLGIADEVRFVGFRTGAALYQWYDRADFFILPSRYEPFGAVVNEALILGCPVVASRFNGALDFLEGTPSLVFDPLDPEDFRKTLQEGIDHFPAPMGPRPCLMRVSFEQAVRVFMTIDDDTL